MVKQVLPFHCTVQASSHLQEVLIIEKAEREGIVRVVPLQPEHCSLQVQSGKS
jgi:hypothetical protein